MTRNQLPEGVGKKIVEALKRQTGMLPSESVEESAVDVSISEHDIANIDFDSLQEPPVTGVENGLIAEDTAINKLGNFNKPEIDKEHDAISQNIVQEEKEPVLNIKNQDGFSPFYKEPVPQTPLFNKIENNTMTVPFDTDVNNSNVSSLNVKQPLSEEPVKPVTPVAVSVKIPPNVAILRNLIASLPVGVTKQTGAQIIRQTLEAMGLPMAGVLKEAQEVQETLNMSSRECMLKIQEFKTNIMLLEQSVQEYQKNVTQINDLVSLFLLTDRK